MGNHRHPPPETNLQPYNPKTGNPLLGVTVGVVLDIVLTLSLDILRSIWLGIYIGYMRGAHGSELTFKQFLESSQPWDLYFNMGIVLSMVATIVASYACAEIVKKKVYRYVSIMIVIVIAVSIILKQNSKSVELLIIQNIMAYISAMVGAWLYQFRSKQT